MLFEFEDAARWTLTPSTLPRCFEVFVGDASQRRWMRVDDGPKLRERASDVLAYIDVNRPAYSSGTFRSF